jgi:hypothetical protein
VAIQILLDKAVAVVDRLQSALVVPAVVLVVQVQQTHCQVHL